MKQSLLNPYTSQEGQNMLLLLAIIAVVVGLSTACYYIHVYVKERYHYAILSIGGMAVSFIGAIAQLFAVSYYRQGLPLNVAVALIIGFGTYVAMFIWDSRKASVTIAMTAMIMRWVISLIIIAALVFCLFGSNSERKQYDHR